MMKETIPQLDVQPVKTYSARNGLQLTKLLVKRIFRHLPLNHDRLLPKLLAHLHNQWREGLSLKTPLLSANIKK